MQVSKGVFTVKKQDTLQQTKNDVPQDVRAKSVAILNARLALALDLKLQAKQAHWNVKGPTFIALHELFDKIVDVIDDAADVIAERAVQLGGVAEGTIQAVQGRTTLVPYPLTLRGEREHLEALSTAIAAFGKSVRAAIGEAAGIGDADTSNVFTEVSRSSDKYLWFVEAHLDAGRSPP